MDTFRSPPLLDVPRAWVCRVYRYMYTRPDSVHDTDSGKNVQMINNTVKIYPPFINLEPLTIDNTIGKYVIKVLIGSMNIMFSNIIKVQCL